MLEPIATELTMIRRLLEKAFPGAAKGVAREDLVRPMEEECGRCFRLYSGKPDCGTCGFFKDRKTEFIVDGQSVTVVCHPEDN